MGAPCQHARRPGTGQIRRAKNKYLALAPQEGCSGLRPEHRIGLYHTRFQAERALDEWLRANGK